MSSISIGIFSIIAVFIAQSSGFALNETEYETDDNITETTTTTTTTIQQNITTTTIANATTSFPPIIYRGASWQCGTGGGTKTLSQLTILFQCAGWRDEINTCCIDHDACYDEQLGQEFCDDIFCEQIAKYTKGSGVCHDTWAPLFCAAVRRYGAEAYKAAGRSQGQHRKISQPEEVHKIEIRIDGKVAIEFEQEGPLDFQNNFEKLVSK